MVHIHKLKDIYNFDTEIHNKNIYTEYLQYLILKKMFNYDFGIEIFLSGDFYNRIKFNMPRFSNSLDLISETMLKNQRNQIYDYILKSLALEGYEVKLNQKDSQAVIRIRTENLSLYEDDQESKDDTPIVININFYKSDFFNEEVKAESININKFDVCTRINTITPDLALSLLAKKIIKSKKMSSVELFDLYYFKNLNYSIDIKYFNKALQEKIPGELYKLSIKISKDKLIKDFSKCVINKNTEEYADMIKDRSWVKIIYY